MLSEFICIKPDSGYLLCDKKKTLNFPPYCLSPPLKGESRGLAQGKIYFNAISYDSFRPPKSPPTARNV